MSLRIGDKLICTESKCEGFTKGEVYEVYALEPENRYGYIARINSELDWTYGLNATNNGYAMIIGVGESSIVEATFSNIARFV